MRSCSSTATALGAHEWLMSATSGQIPVADERASHLGAHVCVCVFIVVCFCASRQEMGRSGVSAEPYEQQNYIHSVPPLPPKGH